MENFFKIKASTLQDLRATKDQVRKAEHILNKMDKWDDYDTTPIDIAFNAMDSDDDSRIAESRNLIQYYKHSCDTVKAAIDMTLVCLCGWSLGSLIDEMEEPETSDDDDAAAI